MPQFAANLSMLYPELDFLDRFDAAAQDGFKGVEFLFPYGYATRDIRARLQANDLQLVLFNAPPAGSDRDAMASAWARGERGTACLAGRESEFRHGITHAIDTALALECPRIHVMAGLAPQGADGNELESTYIANLQHAAQQAAIVDLQLLIEPINTRDMPHYYLTHQAQAHAVVRSVGAPHLQVQMDIYHCQIMEGDIATKLRQYLPHGRVGHMQIAGVPDRHEPDPCELNYPYLFSLIDELGYDGWVGCEYRPRLGNQPGGTRQGLSWMPR